MVIFWLVGFAVLCVLLVWAESRLMEMIDKRLSNDFSTSFLPAPTQNDFAIFTLNKTESAKTRFEKMCLSQQTKGQ